MATKLESRYAPTERTPQVTGSDTGRVETAGNSRWLWIYVTLAILVLLVVIGFLIGISNALVSIDTALEEADAAVGGIEGDAGPLPDQVAQVNETLGAIDQSLLPVPGQAEQIVSSLTSINGSLTSVDASLVDTLGSLGNTSSSLVDTSGSLVNTSDVLVTVLGIGGEIRQLLEVTQSTGAPPGQGLAADNIWMRVEIANSVLGPVQGDTGNVVPELVGTDAHLESICTALPTPGPCVP